MLCVTNPFPLTFRAFHPASLRAHAHIGNVLVLVLIVQLRILVASIPVVLGWPFMLFATQRLFIGVLVECPWSAWHVCGVPAVLQAEAVILLFRLLFDDNVGQIFVCCLLSGAAFAALAASHNDEYDQYQCKPKDLTKNNHLICGLTVPRRRAAPGMATDGGKPGLMNPPVPFD